MAELMSRMSPKGQVTIPIQVRHMLGLKPADRVVFRVEHGQVKLVPAPSALDTSFQAIPPLRHSMSLQEMEALAAEEAAHQAIKEGDEA